MPDQLNFADCYVLTNQRTYIFLHSFLNHFLPEREAHASEYEVPQQADHPDHVFKAPEDLITYLENHPNERHAIYWQNKQVSTVRAGMCLFTSDGQVIVGLTSETHYPDTYLEDSCLKQLKEFCKSSIGLIEYDTPAAKDTAAFMQRIKNASP